MVNSLSIATKLDPNPTIGGGGGVPQLPLVPAPELSVVTTANMASATSPSAMEEDCKGPNGQIKLEVLDELFGYGWDENNLSVLPSNLSFSSLTPVSSIAALATPPSLVISSAPTVQRSISLQNPPPLKLPMSPPSSVMSSLKSPSFSVSPSPPLLAGGSSSGASNNLGNNHLRIVIPSHPDTTTNNVTSPLSAGSSSAGSSSQSLGGGKKTVFTAKGKTKYFFFFVSTSPFSERGEKCLLPLFFTTIMLPSAGMCV